METPKSYIIAGNRQEFLDWTKSKIEEHFANGNTTLTLSHFVFVTEPNQLIGLVNPHGYFIGTWRNHPDIRHILISLMTAYDGPAPQSVVNFWNEINGH